MQLTDALCPAGIAGPLGSMHYNQDIGQSCRQRTSETVD